LVFYVQDQKYRFTVVHDITARHHAEEEIKSLLAEKELILKEVHHRLKNNMNTIKSLLILQSDTLKETSAIKALKDAENRVHSMMVLFDKLYQAADISELSIKEYLQTLVDDIVANFPNSSSVKVVTLIDDFILDAKRLQPLGLIINELLTNIMKYAFTGKDSGLITVSASKKNKEVTICIKDNGNGMPESIDFENSTGFGLMLVGMLTKQINGKIRIERSKGTTIILEFEV